MELAMMTCFIVKHFICDFPIQIQTPWMFLNKGIYGHLGGIAHAAIHMSASYPILVVFMMLSPLPEDYLRQDLGLFYGLLLFEGLVHYHMDWFKMWWVGRKGYYPDVHPQFWTWLGIDQMVHYLTYVVMVWLWL